MSRGRALVTGAHGFVGSHLAAGLLREGWRVRVLERPDVAGASTSAAGGGGARRSGLDLLGVRSEVEPWAAELLDAAAVAGAVAGCEAVFHLAAQTIVGVARRQPLATLETNVRGAWNVFEGCRLEEVGTVLFASSYKAYGAPAELPYREDFPLRAAAPYEASNAAADTIARSYAATYELPLAVVRLANLYGPGDLNFTRLIPEACRALCEGRAPEFRSDGSPKRDFLHVDDAVAAYLALAEALAGGADGARGEAFNAGADEPRSVREVVDLIAAADGDGVEPRYGPGVPEGEVADQYLDSSKLRALTGWAPAMSLPVGLGLTLDWYRNHPEVLP